MRRLRRFIARDMSFAPGRQSAQAGLLGISASSLLVVFDR